MYLNLREKIWSDAPPPCTIGIWYFSETAESASAKLLANGPSRKFTLSWRDELRVLAHAQIDVGLVVVELEGQLAFRLPTLTPPFALILSIANS